VKKLSIIQRVVLGLVALACVAVGLVLGLVVVRKPEPERAPPAEPKALSLAEHVDRALDEGLMRLEAGIRLTPDDKRFLLAAARTVLERRLRDGESLAAAHWKDVPPNVASQEAKVFVTLIAGGRTRGCMSGTKGNLLERIALATERAIADKRFGGAVEPAELASIRIDIALLLDPEDVTVRDPRLLRREIEVGVHALSLERGGRRAFFKSSVPVAHGYDLRKTLERLGIKAGLGPNAYKDRQTRIRKYVTVHFCESPVDRSLVEVYRYNLPFPQTAATADAMTAALRACGEYMVRHTDETGLLTYSYNVYKDERENPEKPAALIRRLASTWILAALGNEFDEPRYTAAAKKGVTLALRTYYHENPDEGFGYIQVGEDANLAFPAFALLCLAEINDEDFHARERDMLLKFIFAMEDREKGRLRPVYLPEGDALFAKKELYYPGEALTALMRVYDRTKDPACLELAGRVFDYYVALWDRAPKRASMTPWMSKAYTAAFLATGERKYADFVLRMNDRLVKSQQRLGTPYADRIGSFSDGGSCCTAGVFAEAIVEAYRVAEALDDAERMKRYGEAIALTCRFLLQSQYRPENTLTALNAAQAFGGMRTSVYDTSVRIDTVQHAACALLKALRHVD